jgi:hypothetical protein
LGSGFSATAFGAFDGSTMLGFASFASVGGFGRGTAAEGTVLGAGVGALTVAETVSTAFGFSTETGTTGFGGVDVAAVAFAEVVEAVPEAGRLVAVVGAGGVVVGDTGAGATGAVVVATAAAAGQRCP